MGNVKTKRIKPTKKTRINIDPNELITIVSNTIGGLVYVNGTGSVRFNISNYGNEHYLTYYELQELRNRQKNMIDNVYFIIEHDELIEFWGLKQKYENIVMSYEVDDFFELDVAKMTEKLLKMNSHCQDVLYMLALERHKNGNLDSSAKQNVFTKLKKIDLFNRSED